MIFTPTPLPGEFVFDPERFEDDRGFFARTWCPRELEAHGLNPRLAQCSFAYNRDGGHAPRYALPGRTARRGENRPLHRAARSST